MVILGSIICYLVNLFYTMHKLKQHYATPVGEFEEVILDEEKAFRIILTGNCNLACEFCAYKIRDFYSPEVHSDSLIEMRPTKDLEKILIELKSRLNYNIVHLTGGEPALAKKIFEIAELSKNNGYSVNLCSNLVCPKPIEKLIEANLLDELTFSYLPLDTGNQRHWLASHKRPDKNRIETTLRSISGFRSIFQDLIIKTNIIMSPYADMDVVEDFVYWCWDNEIDPRMQRDRSSDRISGSTEITNMLLKRLNAKPKRVTLRVPGATEICEFNNPDEKSIFVKVFNKNFRPQEICKICHMKAHCSKSLSSIRVYQTEEGPFLCFCTQHNEDFAHLNIDRFLRSEVLEELKGYKDDKRSYFERFCTHPNFQ